MKLIKNLATLLLVVFSISTASAQSTDAKKLIVNKWVIDKEAMKPIIMAMMATNPQFMGMDEAGRASTIEMVMEQASKLKVEYKADGTLSRTDSTGDGVGTWTLSADGKELTTKSEGKPEKKFTILEISKTKLNVMSSDGRNVILKTE